MREVRTWSGWQRHPIGPSSVLQHRWVWSFVFFVHPGSFWSKLGFSPQVWFIRATSRNPGACADGVQMCATLFWIWGRLVVAVVTGQSWAPICLNKEALWFVSSWKRVESVELRVAEPTRTRRYLLDLATAFRHTWKSLFWRWRLVWHGPGTWVPVPHCTFDTKNVSPFRGLIHANHYDQDTKVWEHICQVSEKRAHQTTLETDDRQPVRPTFWNSYTTLRQLRLRRHDCRDSFRMFQVFMWILIYWYTVYFVKVYGLPSTSCPLSRR